MAFRAFLSGLDWTKGTFPFFMEGEHFKFHFSVSDTGKCCALINPQPIADRLSEKRLEIPIDNLFLFFFFKLLCGGFVNGTY